MSVKDCFRKAPEMKAYRKMTKKRPMRGLRLFKQKYLNKQGFYAFLAKIRLVREVSNCFNTLIINNDAINKVRLLEDKIETDRGIFNLSFLCRGRTYTQQCWYESRFKSHKRLYTVKEEKTLYLEAEVRSQCEEFEVRIDPFNHIRVSRNNCHYHLPVIKPVKAFMIDDKIKVKKIDVDFLNARLGVSVVLSASDPTEETIEELVKECVQKATVQMRNYIEGNSEAINERLTGIKGDGEFITPAGQRLLPNCICHRCGRPVFEPSHGCYVAYCVRCDEDLHRCEIDKVDPERYKDIYELNKEELYQILSE